MACPARRRWPRAALALPALATALALSAGGAGAQDVERVTRAQVIEKLNPVPLQTAPGAPLPLAAGGTVPGIAPPRRAIGAPPRFGVPVGGRADAKPEPGFPGYSRVTVRRANGRVYASAMLAPSGDYEEVEYYDRAGEPTYLTVSLPPAERGRPAPRSAGAAGPVKLPTLGDSRAPRVYEPTAFCGRNFHAGEPHRLRGALYGFRINAGSFPAVPWSTTRSPSAPTTGTRTRTGAGSPRPATSS